ncbi:hypothetical protein ABK040_005077 [Willaertia magna]
MKLLLQCSFDFKGYFDEQLLSDMTIKFLPSNRILKGHKLILFQYSEVFKTMFETGMQEQKENQLIINSEELYISESNFINVLKLMYSYELDINEINDLLEIFQIAHIYQINKLIEIMKLNIKTIKSVNDLISFFCFVVPFETNDKYEYLNENSKTFLEGLMCKFTDNDVENYVKENENINNNQIISLLHFILDDTIKAKLLLTLKEIDLDILLTLLKNIDFKSVDNNVVMELLSKTEFENIKLYKAIIESFVHFTEIVRGSVFSKSESWSYGGSVDSIIIKVSRRNSDKKYKSIKLSGISLFAKQNSSYETNIVIIDLYNNSIIYTKIFTYTNNKGKDYYCLTFDENITLRWDARFEIQVIIKGDTSMCLKDACEKVEKDNILVKFEKSPNSTNGTNLQQGQFYSFSFTN